MCFTIDQIEQACGLMLLTEFNKFVYCCKKCPRKFETGFHLEVHILSKHKDDKETVFVHENVFVDEFEPTPVEYESSNVKTEQFELNTDVFDESNIEDHAVDEVRPLAVLLVNENMDNDNNCIETNKVKDEVPFDETIEEHLEEYVEPESNNMEIEKPDVDPISTHSSMKKHKCPHCDKLFSSPSKLQDHIYAIHTQERNYICDICEKDFKTKFALKIHKLTHGEAKLKCRYCESMFTQPASRFKHEKNIHRKVVRGQTVVIEKKTNRCEICNKIPKRGLENHMKRFHTDFRYKCDLCDATFTKSVYKEVHMRTHTGERPFICATCGKAFSSYSGCYIHETRVHSSLKKHQCPHCDKSFIFRCHLKDHINAIHTNERPYDCDVCGKNFVRQGLLTVHKLTHGEAKLKCRYCEKMFTQSASRWSHEKHVHKKVISVGDRRKKSSRKSNGN